MSLFMEKYLTGVLAVLSLLVLLALVYAVLGRRFTDKIVGANMIGSLGVNLIVVLALLLGADYILDVGLVFALLAFLMVIVLCRFVQNYSLRRRDAAEEEEKEGRP